MYMTVSKISRQNAEPCTNADIDTVVKILPSFAAFRSSVVTKQSEGKIIYRSHSINGSDELETVTLYATQGDYNAFKADAAFIAFAAALEGIYNPIVVTEEFI
jgi:hypothetical protein